MVSAWFSIIYVFSLFISPKLSADSTAVFQYGIVPFTTAIADETGQTLSYYFNSFDAVLFHELNSTDGIEVKRIIPRGKLKFQPAARKKGLSAQNKIDPINQEFEKLAKYHQLDAIIIGQIDEDLLEKKLYIIFRTFSLKDRSYETMIKILDKKDVSVSAKTLTTAMKEVVDYLETAGSAQIAVTPGTTVPGKAPTTGTKHVSKVREETFDDLESFVNQHRRPAKPVSPPQQVPEQKPAIFDIYHMIYSNAFYICINPLRFDAIRSLTIKKLNPQADRSNTDFSQKLRIGLQDL